MSQPLSPEEQARFVREMAVIVSRRLAAGERFRITADTPESIRLFQEVTSRVAEVLGRPVTGYGNGREFFIAVGHSEALA